MTNNTHTLIFECFSSVFSFKAKGDKFFNMINMCTFQKVMSVKFNDLKKRGKTAMLHEGM